MFKPTRNPAVEQLMSWAASWRLPLLLLNLIVIMLAALAALTLAGVV